MDEHRHVSCVQHRSTGTANGIIIQHGKKAIKTDMR